MTDFMKKGYRLRPNELLKQDPGLSNEIVLWVEIYGIVSDCLKDYVGVYGEYEGRKIDPTCQKCTGASIRGTTTTHPRSGILLFVEIKRDRGLTPFSLVVFSTKNDASCYCFCDSLH